MRTTNIRVPSPTIPPRKYPITVTDASMINQDAPIDSFVFLAIATMRESRGPEPNPADI